MDNERFTIDKRKFKIAIIGANYSSSASLGTMIHLAMEATICHMDIASDYEPSRVPNLTIIDELRHDYMIQGNKHFTPITKLPRDRKRCRGGGHFDVRGRRR